MPWDSVWHTGNDTCTSCEDFQPAEVEFLKQVSARAAMEDADSDRNFARNLFDTVAATMQRRWLEGKR